MANMTAIAIAAETEENVDIAIIYKNLQDMSNSTPFSELDLLVRLRTGIKPKHADNVLYLYFYHLYKTDKELYKKLCDAKSEQEMKTLLGNKVMKNYQGAVKSTCIFSDLFSKSFLQIINAYLDYVERS